MTAVASFPGTINNTNTNTFFFPSFTAPSTSATSSASAAIVLQDPDFDSFFDFSQGSLQPSSDIDSPASPTNTFSPSQAVVDPHSIMLPTDHGDDRQQHLPGPSHEYYRFRQQTGLPSGVNLNVPSLDDPYGQSMSRHNSFAVANGFQMNTTSYDNLFPADFDFGGPSMMSMQNTMMPYDTTFNDFFDPNMVEEMQPQPVNRLFPGMHSQQAELAKAEALARQQQQVQAQQMQMMSQQCQPSAFAAAAPPQMQLPVAATNARQQPNNYDPVAEDKITRILNQMRNNSTASSVDDDDEASNEHGQGARSRKDEDDMDEDERLLASEEGKKLSSKERRQLRNKVSARAFRSRRKEYISQLEGEIAGKVTECNDLKSRNRQLNNQNAQLIQLTQNLLRHPAFASVLEDMSSDPSILAPMENLQTASTPVKEESMQQSNDITHVGMTMVPETNLDFSMLNLGSSHGQGYNVSQPQVFAVMALPEEPVFSASLLAGKTVAPASASTKMTAPAVEERLPACFAQAKRMAPFMPRFTAEEKEDPSSALYVDASAPAPAKAAQITVKEASRLLEDSLSGKQSVYFNMVSSDDVDVLFAPLSSISTRVETLTTSFF